MFSRFFLSMLVLFVGILPLDAVIAATPTNPTRKQITDEERLRLFHEWMEQKKIVSIKALGGDLTLSGEVRTEFQDINEKRNGIRQRGANGATPRPSLAWDIEFNFMLDYRSEYTWMAVKIEFDNDMGIRSGTTNRIRLEKAFLGGRLISGDTFTLDGEIGHRYLATVFDSRIEFGAFFDGAALRINEAFNSLGDAYWVLGAFIVDDLTNHYGYVGEMGLLRIGHTGFNAKYSIIDWRKSYPNPQKNKRFQFLVQQAIISYQWIAGWIGNRPIRFYAAALNNIIAKNLSLPIAYPPNPLDPPIGIPRESFGKQNWGFYIGFSGGQLRRAGDWVLDVNFQWLQAQTVPDFDMMGIGRGNSAAAGLYTTFIDGSGTYTTVSNAAGSGNYFGFHLDAIYAFTDNLSIEQDFAWSTTLDTDLGPLLQYKFFELEFIYAF